MFSSFMLLMFDSLWVVGNVSRLAYFQGANTFFCFFSQGSIELLGSQAILLRSTKRHATNGWTKESFELSTIVSVHMGSTIICRASCSEASRTRSRCLLNSHFTHSKHTHHALYLIFLQPFLFDFKQLELFCKKHKQTNNISWPKLSTHRKGKGPCHIIKIIYFNRTIHHWYKPCTNNS